jgi:hypothetical protein
MIRREDRFLPYTMSAGRQYPLLFLRTYLKLPLAVEALWEAVPRGREEA